MRHLYDPEHGRETERDVLVASYTWGEDAQRWGWLSERDRVEQAVADVAQIHPQILEEFEVSASHMWQNDEFAGGAFALFDPGQQTLLHAHIVQPEGRIHFAGEHTSQVIAGFKALSNRASVRLTKSTPPLRSAFDTFQ